MRLFKQASATLEDVSDASKKVVNTTEWASIALIVVAAVSVLALGIAVTALSRGNTRD